MPASIIRLRNQSKARGVTLFAICLLIGARSFAGDWPQILGPSRNGKAENEPIADRWPNDGPRLAWQREVGSGYAGVAVVGGTLVLWHRVGDESLAEGLAVATGRPLWKVAFPTSYTSTIAPDDGPRCVPLIDGDRVFVVGAQGDLHCLALKDGKKLWSRNTFEEFNAPEGYFGAGSTPIVAGDLLVMNVGGPGAGIVAFSLKDGSTQWKVTDEAASYASPCSIMVDGKRQLIFATRLTTVALDPANGKVAWRYPFGMRGPTVNGATPLVIDGHLFLSASYGIGARWLKLSSTGVDEVWDNGDLMSSQYTTCIEHEGVLYGIDGRQDQGIARLRAIDPLAQKILWTEEEFGTGNLILADGKLVILKTDGELILATPDRNRYVKLANAKVLETTAQALPALAEGRLFVRDTNTLKCLLLR